METTTCDLMALWALLWLPPQRQDRTCVAGEMCSLEGLVGTDSTGIARLALLDTCGLADAPQQLHSTALATSASGAVVSASGGAMLASAGGSYRLCWCAALAMAGAGNASEGGRSGDSGPPPCVRLQHLQAWLGSQVARAGLANRLGQRGIHMLRAHSHKASYLCVRTQICRCMCMHVLLHMVMQMNPAWPAYSITWTYTHVW